MATPARAGWANDRRSGGGASVRHVRGARRTRHHRASARRGPRRRIPHAKGQVINECRWAGSSRASKPCGSRVISDRTCAHHEGALRQTGETSYRTERAAKHNDAIDELHGFVAHAPRAAARAQAAILARKGDEDVVAAAACVAAKEPARDVAAGEVVLEGLDPISGQRGRIGALGVGDKGRQVLADDTVEHRVVRAARGVLGGGGGGHTGPCARAVPVDFPCVCR
jgi:hypothetical protein